MAEPQNSTLKSARSTPPIMTSIVVADIKKVLEGFDSGIFVRSVTGDDDPAWAIRLMPYLSALARLQMFAELKGGAE